MVSISVPAASAVAAAARAFSTLKRPGSEMCTGRESPLRLSRSSKRAPCACSSSAPASMSAVSASRSCSIANVSTTRPRSLAVAAIERPIGGRDVHGRVIRERGREEARLRGDVRVDRAVIVEVVLRQVGEARDRETGAVDAVLIERMRRHFHRDRLDPGVAHAYEQRLQLRRLGSRVAEAFAPRRVARFDRADDSGAETAGVRDRLEEVARGGLPVRAGDSEHGHRP